MNIICQYEAYKFCEDHLLGATVVYALKSPDVNLYDLGFVSPKENSKTVNKVVLHVMCSLVVRIHNYGEKRYYGDSNKQEFEAAFSCIIGECVQGISLGEHGDLEILFDESYIRITPADDSNESWRIFYDCACSTHLIVSDTNFNLLA